MIYSMTGYGKAELNLKVANLIIELKALNSKQIDINIKIPAIYNQKEIILRKLISEKLKRGKIELSIWRKKTVIPTQYKLNKIVLKDYYKQIINLKKDLQLKWNFWRMTPFLTKSTDIITVLLKMPDVIQKEEEKINVSEWGEIEAGVNTAIENLLKFRATEGKKLGDDISDRIIVLNNMLKKIIPFAKQRIEKVKQTLNIKLKALKEENIDKNRLEQELIYYLEKQDITEEQVRLISHLEYFVEIMNAESLNGKKLGFLAQEIGREINTIGAKCSDAEMQKIVIQMKDELEKIKEQLLNIL